MPSAVASLPATAVYEDFVDSAPLLTEPEALRHRAAEDGYLFVRGLLPRDLVMELRRQILEVCKKYGWLRSDTPLLEGRCNLENVNKIPETEVRGGMGIPLPAYADVQRLELFHAIAQHPAIMGMYRALFGEAVFAHPRNIARVILPHHRNTPTPPHQDFIHVQGAVQTWTLWFPLGDCPSELGGLAVLKGSDQDGLLSVHEAAGAGGLEVHICNTGRHWVTGPMHAGDVLTFNSIAVHKAMPNVHPDGDRVRLSCDFRYQAVSDPVEKASLEPHGHVLTWDQIYHGWKDSRIQYYWRETHPKLSAWDESIRWQKEKIC